MSDAYDKDLARLARQIAKEQGCANFLQEGVYCMLAGPNYETIAECKMLQLLGADAVGEWKNPQTHHSGYGVCPDLFTNNSY